MISSKKYSRKIFEFQFSKRYTTYTFSYNPTWHTPKSAVEEYVRNYNSTKRRSDAQKVAIDDVKYSLVGTNRIKIEIPKNEKYQNNNSMIYVYLLLCYFDIDLDGQLKYKLDTIAKKINDKLSAKRIGQITCDLAKEKLIKKDMKIKRATTYAFTNDCKKKYIFIADEILLHPDLSPAEIVNYVKLKIIATNKGGKFTIYKTNNEIRNKLNILQKQTWIKLKKKLIHLGLLAEIEGGFELPIEKANYEELKQAHSVPEQSENLISTSNKSEKRPSILNEVNDNHEPVVIEQDKNDSKEEILQNSEIKTKSEPKVFNIEIQKKHQALMNRRKTMACL